MAASTSVQNEPGQALRRSLRALVAAAADVIAARDERALAQRNAAVAFLVRVASAGILYLSQVVLARWMGAYEYGIYVFVWTWVLVLGGLSTLGLPVVMMRLLPEYLVHGEHGRVRGLLNIGQRAVLVSGTVMGLVGMAVIFLAREHINNHYVLPALIAFVCVPMWTLSDVHDGIGRSRGWMTVALLPPYVMRPLLLLGCMTVTYVAGWPMDAASAAASAIVATWLTAIFQAMVVNVRFARELGPGTREISLRPLVLTSLPLFVVTLSEMALQTIDVLVVSAFLSPSEVGMYFAAAKTMSLVMFVHYAVGSAVANRFSALKAKGDHAGLEALATDAVGWTFWPSLAGAVVILALGKPLLWLFSPNFTDAYPVMAILALGFLAKASVGPADFILNMLGEQTRGAVILIVSALLSLVVSILLVPRLGMIGAAIATSVAFTASACLHYIVARMRLGLRISIFHGRAGR